METRRISPGPRIAPSNVYPCADGDLLIAANQDSVFERLCRLMGREDWIRDPRFVDHRARGANQDLLDGLISDWTRPQRVADLEAAMIEAGVPAGRINRAPEMLADPQFAAREAIVDVPHPTIPNLKMQAVFPKLSRTPGEVAWPGATLGAHNEDVYRGLLGLDAERLESLRRGGAI